jgi:hypothetical protein
MVREIQKGTVDVQEQRPTGIDAGFRRRGQPRNDVVGGCGHLGSASADHHVIVAEPM